jgi:hypothetical protein
MSDMPKEGQLVNVRGRPFRVLSVGDGFFMIAPADCRLPPFGWWCSRSAGHEGPCAARLIPLEGEAPHPPVSYQAAAKDRLLYGESFEVDGQRIDPRRVTVTRQQAARVDDALDAQLLTSQNDGRRVWQILEAAGVSDPRAALEAALSAQPAPATNARERLGDERWRLMNSFGNGAFADGKTRDRIAEIDTELAAQPAERQGEVAGYRAKSNYDCIYTPSAVTAQAAMGWDMASDPTLEAIYTYPAAPVGVGVPDGNTLPIDIRGKWHDVPIPVHLHIIALRDRLEQLDTDETLVNVYGAVSRSNLTRDVKSPGQKAGIVREALSAAPPAPHDAQQEKQP